MCFLIRSFSSSQQSELLNGGAAGQRHMTPAAVIDRQIARQPVVPFSGGLKGHGVCPLRQQGLDKPLGFAVGSWGVWPRAFRDQAQCAASFSPGF